MAEHVELRAGGGLTVTVDHDGYLRVAWSEPDWLGPARLSLAGRAVEPETTPPADGRDDIGPFTSCTLTAGGIEASVRTYADEPLAVFRLAAPLGIDDLATGDYASPSVAWPHIRPASRQPRGVPDGTTGFAFQHSEFAFPTTADDRLGRWLLLPHRPRALGPVMLLAPDGRTLLLAPIDSFHEQVAAVPPRDDRDDGLRFGWHGDLAAVPAGFATELALFAGDGPRDCIDRWGALLRARNRTPARSRYADTLGSRPSYWTDNGAAYWYRTEPGHDVTATLSATVDDLRARGVPFGAVQLDSWFYPHEVLRPFDTDERVVPPSGLMRWEPRDDILPDGIGALREALGDPPLVTHCRHLSAQSPYGDDFPVWVDGENAHPATSELYERWFDQARAWGVETFEHDWLVQCFFAVRQLREVPGRARAWQEGIDRAAAERGMTLQWCMPTPADLAQTVTLPRVTSIRTSGDHGYMVEPGLLWAWFLYVNALARALGLHPFKDVFHSGGRHADVEALLSALSTGPVAIGDRLGKADPAVIRRTCRADGVLVKPHEPIAAVDRSFLAYAAGDRRMVGEAVTHHRAGDWVYVLTLNVSDDGEPLDVDVALADLGGAAPAGPVVVWDWRSGTCERLDPDASWSVSLPPQGWDYRVVAPVLDGDIAVVGDPSLYATAGDRRLADAIATPGGVRCTVLGAGETVTLAGWSEGRGPWEERVDVPDRGWAVVEIPRR